MINWIKTKYKEFRLFFKPQFRVLNLKNGKYALQHKIMLSGWTSFTRLELDDNQNGFRKVMTFDTKEDAEAALARSFNTSIRKEKLKRLI